MQRRVQFYETDAAGLVHFSWFNRYMEEAEHALWREAGLSIAPPDAVIGFPRVSASFDFKRPLVFEDVFEVWLVVVEIADKTMTYRADVCRGSTAVARGRLTVACVRKAPGQPLKAISIPREIVDRFEVYAGEEPSP